MKIKAILPIALLCLSMASIAVADGQSASAEVVHGKACWVSKLTGKTLPQVRRAYLGKKRWCRLGQISGDRSGVVVRQSPAHTGWRRAQVAVHITLR